MHGILLNFFTVGFFFLFICTPSKCDIYTKTHSLAHAATAECGGDSTHHLNTHAAHFKYDNEIFARVFELPLNVLNRFNKMSCTKAGCLCSQRQ